MRDTLTPLLSDSTRPTPGRRLRLIFGIVLAVLATVAFLVPPAAVGSSDAADEWPWDVEPGEDSDLFPLVGEIDFRGADGEKLATGPDPVGIDAGLGVAVFVDDDGDQMFLVDTQTLEYTVIPDPGEGHVVTGNAIVDGENHRLIMHGEAEAEFPGEDVHGCGGSGTELDKAAVVTATACEFGRGQTLVVTVVDLLGRSEPVTRFLDLGHFGDQQVDDASGVGLARPFDYHAPSDSLYLATQPEGVIGTAHRANAQINLVRSPILHEVPVDELVSGSLGDGPVAPSWSYALQACANVSEKGVGALARSRRGNFIYLACEGATGTSHGIARVDLAADPSDFRASFEPFVGKITEGKVGIDKTNDLVFAQVNFNGARMYVYDAYRQAWTGAAELTRELEIHGNKAAGENHVTPASDPRTGRLYAFHGDLGTLRVTEADWPAVPNSVGRRSDHHLGAVSGQRAIDNPPLVDSDSKRIFVQELPMCERKAEDGTCAEQEMTQTEPFAPHLRVFEDRLPDRPTPAIHPDYDARTSDLPEEPGVATSTATGNAKAFGARHLFVGGTQNMAWTPAGSADFAARGLPIGPAGRDLIRGQVLGSNLSRISTPTVGALATGLHIADEQTTGDLQRNTDVRCAPSRTASLVDGEADCLSDDWQSDEPGEQEREMHRRWDGSSWPEDYPEELRGRSAYCDDFGGDPSEDAKPGSAVACDSGGPQVSAGALFSPTEDNASADGETPGVHVGYAESSTDVHEDEALGMVATASAVARDVDLFSQVSIGEVRTEATAVAHGRPGTASTELVREYRQVRIGDFACGWQDDNPCDLYEVAHQINEQLGPQVVARVPAQDTFLNPDSGDEPDAQTGEARVSNGTPAGAKALVTTDPYQYQSGKVISNDTRSELPGLQITVYHDNDRTSRQILQLAAVELDVGYRISPAATWDAPDWGSGDGTGGDDGLDLDEGLSDTVGGAATRSIVPPPPFAHLSQDSPSTSSDDGPPTTGDTGDVAGFDGGDGAVSQGDAPSLGTADGPAVGTGDGVPAPEVASDSSGGQPVAAQDTQGGASGPGGLMLTRQRMGQTVPFAVLWVLAALPFYLAVRRRRLTSAAPRT